MTAIANRKNEKCSARKRSSGVNALSEKSVETERNSRNRGKSSSTNEETVRLQTRISLQTDEREELMSAHSGRRVRPSSDRSVSRVV